MKFKAQGLSSYLLIGAVAIFHLGACSKNESALDIAKNTLIVDTHIDVPYRLERKYQDISLSTKGGDFDYPRALEGGLNASFMSIYIPADVDQKGGGFDLADKLIDSMEDIANTNPEKFAMATCTSDLITNFENKKISIALGMENGGPIAGDMENLQHFYNRGVRYITLTHSKPNHISDSSYDTNQPWDGLSPFGKKLIGIMNDSGIMIDVSHLSDKAFWQVIELSSSPIIASHSSLRHFTKNFERNMSDSMVKATASQGGVIQINFGSNFISQATQDFGKKRNKAVAEYMTKEELSSDNPMTRQFLKEYLAVNPYPYATLDQVLDHIDRVVELGGIESVGIGSDFDGVGDSLPVGLKDVSDYPNLIDGLLHRGYQKVDIEKILGANLLRVWGEVETFSRDKGNPERCSQ